MRPLALFFVLHHFFAPIYSIMFTRGSYKAAVVEFDATRESSSYPEEILQENAENFLRHIKMAHRYGATIIVFPEDGLTTLDVSERHSHAFRKYGVEVPNPDFKPNPCINESMNKILRLISCAASDHSIYVVINLIEKFREHNFEEFYNTNVVFDRTGTIIARYRKINLLNEPKLHPGNEVVTFHTDFGVTFGIFTCTDILYRMPSMEVLRNANVTDIIYPNAWHSETPYLQSLSMQAGYARATGVNLLAAGLSHPPRYGGSGIYLHDGRIAEIYISPSRSSRLMVQEVPKATVKLSALKCHNNSHESPRLRLGGNLNVGLRNTSFEDMSMHTLMPLNYYGLETKSKICNFNGEYCCRFRITLRDEPERHGPKYKMALFYGVRKFGDTTIGVRSCGLVACLTDDRSTCGIRLHGSGSNTVFSRISIRGDFDRNQYRNFDQPITLTFDQTPITEYTYCETLSDDKRRVLIDMRITRPVSNILSFGIHGRLFEYDGRRPGLITNQANYLHLNLLGFNTIVILFVIVRSL